MIRTSIPRAVAAAVASLVLAVTVFAPVSAISNGSHLRFLAGPATANVDATITSVVGAPAALERIQVAIFNGSGIRERSAGIPIRLEIVAGTGTQGALLSGIREALTNEDGVAEFTPSINREGIGYRLVGRAADTASEASGTSSPPNHRSPSTSASAS